MLLWYIQFTYNHVLQRKTGHLCHILRGCDWFRAEIKSKSTLRVHKNGFDNIMNMKRKTPKFDWSFKIFFLIYFTHLKRLCLDACPRAERPYRPSWWPTCSPWPVPTTSSPWTFTPHRSRSVHKVLQSHHSLTVTLNATLSTYTTGWVNM